MTAFSRQDFGTDFVWGTATAAYQIEGAHDQDGRGPSIWDTFTHRPNRFGRPRPNGDIACDFYHLYETDLRLLKSLGFTAFRFSISWSRIMPLGTGLVNEQGLAFYDRIIDTCLALGIEPWITLYHWDLPQALEDKGGWTNRAVVRWFSEFADCCTKAFGHKVKRWMVLNEPTAFTVAGYFAGVHAPGRRSISGFMLSVHHAVLCQGEGGRVIRRNVPDAKIGTTLFCAPIDPMTESPRDHRAASRINALGNRLFIEPALGMGYPVRDAPMLEHLIRKCVHPGDMARAAFDFDFIGLQNYFRMVIRHSWFTPYAWAREIKAKHRGIKETTHMDWEVYPEGIYRIIKQFSQYPNMPEIIITENGAAFPDMLQNGVVNDPQRTDFYQRYLAAILRAKQEGIHVGGYFAWSLMDNFEWAEGYRPRFGLVYVDYPTQQRIVKQSGFWFQEFLKR
jgi:beta-glucosidase